jgi:hypothetical protein
MVMKMIIHERKFEIIDEIEWVHRDKNGKIIKQYKSNTRWNRLLKKLHLKPRNCITYDGMRIVAGLMAKDIGDTAFDYIGIGTGTGGAVVGDRVLGTQKSRLGGALCTGTIVKIDAGCTYDTSQWVVIFSQANDAGLTGTQAITEVGVFKDAAGTTDTMLFRQTFAAESMNWDNGDTLTMTCKCQVKQGSA